MIRMMVAAVGLSLGLMVMPVATTPAKADINITIGGGGKYRISCRRGAEIVEDHGFRRVRARNCSGSPANLNVSVVRSPGPPGPPETRREAGPGGIPQNQRSVAREV